ncbi:uncharacterized protein LOC106084734 [Stomoxys calcitrans]|uniref:uncharacterized protein LOC106084734 n=1 Tax=Stomoxys calcitrans TaxID=35570 RepID=UPI0027E35A16|nr:uncharacterized protein LOC106084734 [Stomoxys calcitrans]
MTAFSKKVLICILFGVFVLLQNTMAQRPPFAGSRPPNGLNQKDKYNNNVVVVTQPEIQDRFGEGEAPISNQIPYGQPQRPPTGFVVTPVSVYTPINRPSTSTSGSSGSGFSAAATPNAENAGAVSFADRFGETDGSNAISGSASTTSTTPNPVHPLDAHGDQELINKLSKLPLDQQPFWFVNHKAIEAQRNSTVANIAPVQSSRGSFGG